MAEAPLRSQPLQPRAAALPSLTRHVFEVGVGGVLRRNVEAREAVLDFFQAHAAAFRDFPGAVQRVFHFAEDGQHLVARLEVELLRPEAEAVRVAGLGAGVDAGEDVLRAVIFLFEIVRVVGGDQRDAGFGREAAGERHHLAVFFELVVLDFEEKVAAAEDVQVFVGEAAGLFVPVGGQRFADVAFQAAGQRDEPLAVLRQQRLVDAGLVIEAFQAGGGGQADEVAIAFLGFAQQRQVVVGSVGFVLDPAVVARDVDFAADDRVHAVLLGGEVELRGAEEIAVIGYRYRRLLQALNELHQAGNLAGAVEQRVVGVTVQVDERLLGHGRSGW